ncbi:MAG TPA: hypothetical protein VFK42_00730 [Acidimicrobiales bacterium]|nr:hypothetical protein [Acidimicrobiales bacterium]
MLLALDLDGVVCDLGPGVAARLHARFGLDTHPSTWHTYDLSHLAVPGEELQPFLSATFDDPALYESAAVCSGARHALGALCDAGWTAVAVTARSPHLAPVTRSWIAAMRLPIDDVRHAPLLGKAQVAASLGAVAAIDDHPDEAESLASVCASFLFSRPWNAAHLPSRCRRLASWPDAAGRLRQLVVAGNEDEVGVGLAS